LSSSTGKSGTRAMNASIKRIRREDHKDQHRRIHET
jgi:hypothetical protein